MKKISVLLTVHNRREKTIQCLRKLFAQEGINNDYALDVFLTDDGCTDGTSDAVRSLFPDVNIIYGDGSLFWNRGMYMAWQAAAKYSVDYFMWLNDDTNLYHDAILRMLKNCEEYRDSILLGSTCDSVTKTSITYGGLDRQGKIVYSDELFLPVFYMHGNFVMIPEKVYLQIGFNDPYYRHSLGDHDYGLMAMKQGIEVLVAPGVYGECDVHGDVSKWKNPKYPIKERWKAFFTPTGQNPFEFFYFRRKHFGLLPACMTFVTNFIHFIFPSFWKNNDYR